MFDWFCSDTCSAQGENQQQLVVYNQHTDEVKRYMTVMMDFAENRTNSKEMRTGYILLRSSLYETYLNQCEQQKKLFVDKEFPPNEKSLRSPQNEGQQSVANYKEIVWKRIPELYKDAELIKGNIDPADIQQGSIGDCYFLAAISALAENPKNILRIFECNSVSKMKTNPYGIYKVIVNVGGQPEEIVIDDYIPIVKRSERPVFCKPVNNEFWVVLLEKAWAKVNGAYSNIQSGSPHEVLNKFSTAPCFCHMIPKSHIEGNSSNSSLERSSFEKFKEKLWADIMEGHEQNFPMCCGSRSQVSKDGIKALHSYALLGAFEVRFNNNQKQRILKIRNPWGDSEYKGEFSESDKAWNSVDPQIRKKIFAKRQNDGIFTMPFDKFVKDFETVNISNCKESYNYSFQALTLSNKETQYFCLQLKEDGEVYITFEGKYKRKGQKYLNNGVSKILVAQHIEENHYEYIDCAMETSLADVTVRCKHLKEGRYIVQVHNEGSESAESAYFQSESKNHCTVSTYSEQQCHLSQIKAPLGFVREFLTSHAIKYNKEKKKVGPNSDDWVAYKLLPQSGFGYLMLSLDAKGKKNFEVKFCPQSIQNSGLTLVHNPNIVVNSESPNKEGFDVKSLTVSPGEQILFIFQINLKSGTHKLTMPPAGFDISRVI